MQWLIRNSDGVRFELMTGYSYDKYGERLGTTTYFATIVAAIAYNNGTLSETPNWETKIEYPRIFENKEYIWVFTETQKKMYVKYPFKFFTQNDKFIPEVIVKDLLAEELLGERRTNFIKAIKDMFQ
jgi:hypothetical protein